MKKLLALLFTFALAISLAIPVFGQDAPKSDDAAAAATANTPKKPKKPKTPKAPKTPKTPKKPKGDSSMAPKADDTSK